MLKKPIMQLNPKNRNEAIEAYVFYSTLKELETIQLQSDVLVIKTPESIFKISKKWYETSKQKMIKFHLLFSAL